MITDGAGTPLAVMLTGGNRNDVIPLLPLVEAVPQVHVGTAYTAPAVNAETHRERTRK